MPRRLMAAAIKLEEKVTRHGWFAPFRARPGPSVISSAKLRLLIANDKFAKLNPAIRLSMVWSHTTTRPVGLSILLERDDIDPAAG